MIVREERRQVERNGKLIDRWVIQIVHRCDQCNVEFVRRSNYPIPDHGMTFCSSTCYGSSLKNGGKLREIVDENCFKKNGTRSVQSLGVVKEKRRKTCIERFGAVSPFGSECVKQKIKETNLCRYGTNNVLTSSEARKKARETLIERYGVENCMHIPGVSEKVAEKLRDVSLEALEKRVRTNIDRYGVEYPTKSSIVQDRRKQNSLEKYGVDHHMKLESSKKYYDFSAMGRLSIEKRLNSTDPWFSKPEREFISWLEQTFSSVKSQVLVNGWYIDAYIEDIGVYVQFDGVFWHGLTMPFDELIKRNYANIVGTVKRDKLQNEWFKENCKKLFRITDVQWKNACDNGTHELLRSMLLNLAVDS